MTMKASWPHHVFYICISHFYELCPVVSWEFFLSGCEGERSEDVVMMLCKAL